MAAKKQFQLDKETLIIIGVLSLTFLWTVNRILSSDDSKQEVGEKPNIEISENAKKKKEVNKANIPLASGKEPIDKIFIQSGCAACHTIPGIQVAKGREGPKLELGSNASKRLADPNYVQESILNPGAYIVEGYRDRVMPRWYGQKLSARAVDKIIKYLLKIEEVT